MCLKIFECIKCYSVLTHSFGCDYSLLTSLLTSQNFHMERTSEESLKYKEELMKLHVLWSAEQKAIKIKEMPIRAWNNIEKNEYSKVI